MPNPSKIIFNRRLHNKPPMTICIAAISEAQTSPKIVFAADRLVSGHVQFEHGNPKIFGLRSNCFLMLAGDPLKGSQVVSYVQKEISDKNIPIENIVNLVSKECIKLRNKTNEERILLPRNLTLEQFYNNMTKFPEWFADGLDEELQEEPYQLSFLLFGIDDGIAHLYEIRSHGEVYSYDTLGFAAIGIGAGQSISELGRFQYGSNIPLSQAIQLTYMAKKEAQRVGGVGRETDLGILYINTNNEIGIWRADKDFLDLLDNQLSKLRGFETQLQKETEEAISKIIYGPKQEEQKSEHGVE